MLGAYYYYNCLSYSMVYLKLSFPNFCCLWGKSHLVGGLSVVRRWGLFVDACFFNALSVLMMSLNMSWASFHSFEVGW